MSVLNRLGISNVRNITSADILLAPTVNLFYGENGSGKTSVLEAVYLLGLGRSFRTNASTPIIQQGQSECAVFGEFADGATLGFSRNRQGTQQIKINGKKAAKRATLAETLPLQLLNSDTFKILEGSPRVRRQFMDWGVFHVEHAFFEHWRQAQKALQNRNRLLKHNQDPGQIMPWTAEFCKHADAIDHSRRVYINRLLPVLAETLSEVMPLDDLRVEYDRGWTENEGLSVVLENDLRRDIRYGHTGSGPHRAELKIKIGDALAVDQLSRGQQKMFVAALKISQGFLLKDETRKDCLYLLDDLSAELDTGNKSKVYELLRSLNAQVLITGIEREALLKELPKSDSRLFHVKHGKIASSATA